MTKLTHGPFAAIPPPSHSLNPDDVDLLVLPEMAFTGACRYTAREVVLVYVVASGAVIPCMLCRTPAYRRPSILHDCRARIVCT